MGRENVAPRYLVVTEKSVRRNGVGLVAARLRDAGAGIYAQAVHQANRTLVAPRVSQIKGFEFSGGPSHMSSLL